MQKIISAALFSILLLVACSPEKKPVAKKVTPVATQKSTQEKQAKTVATKVVSEEENQAKSDPIPEEQLEKAREMIAAATPEQIAAVNAQSKYKMLCAACHGFKGNMKVNGAKDLTKSKISLVESVAQIYHGKGLMTPFKGLLKDAEIVAVAQYIEKELRK
ncbi:MAG: cytochrome c [Saprospiraceae bacterium]